MDINLESYEDLVINNPQSRNNRLKGRFTVPEILQMQIDDMAFVIFNNENITKPEQKKITDYVYERIVNEDNGKEPTKFSKLYKYQECKKEFQNAFYIVCLSYERIKNQLERLRFLDFARRTMPRYIYYLNKNIDINSDNELMEILNDEGDNKYIHFNDESNTFEYNENVIYLDLRIIANEIKTEYSTAKSYIEAFEGWVEENNLIEFIPFVVVEKIDFIKDPFIKYRFLSNYTKNEYINSLKINDIKAKYIKKIALIPDYKDIKADKKLNNCYINLLNKTQL